MNHDQEPNSGDRAAAGSSEPVRSRWTPKPEQIQILENIFNSGTVNPAKDETIKIRKILEQYGSVGDANVFYWFQNRRSRSRRRQRQLQAAAAAAASGAYAGVGYEAGNSTSSTSSGCGGFMPYCSSSSVTSSSSLTTSGLVGDVSGGFVGDDLFSISRQMGYVEGGQNYLYSSDASQLQYQSG